METLYQKLVRIGYGGYDGSLSVFQCQSKQGRARQIVFFLLPLGLAQISTSIALILLQIWFRSLLKCIP